MATDADIVREALRLSHRKTDAWDAAYAALDALDALVAERDEAQEREQRAMLATLAAEAEVARLREALAEIVSYIDKGDVSIETIDQIARAASREGAVVTDANIVREWIGGCLALHGFREDCPACVAYRDAMDALRRAEAAEAERDKLMGERERNRTELVRVDELRRAAEARITELEAALEAIVNPRVGPTGNLSRSHGGTGFPVEIARAALAKEDTDE